MSNQNCWVVFGLGSDGKPHAARFDAGDGELAVKAAAAMGYRAFQASTAEAIELAAQLPLGRVYVSGKAFAPFIKREIYEALDRHCPAGPDQPSCTPDAGADELDGQGESATDPTNELGQTSSAGLWGLITMGSEVLATAPGVEGWWLSEVVGVSEAGNMLTLRWKGFEGEPLFMTPRASVGLLRPQPNLG